MERASADPETALLALLREVGIEARSGSRSDLDLRLPDNKRLIVEVKTYAKPPSPSSLSRSSERRDHRMLYVLQRPSRRMTAAAINDQLDLVDMTNQSVIISGREWHPAVSQPDTTRIAKPAWGRWAVLRSLYLATEPLHQVDLAELSGVSQAAVSSSLPHLRGVLRDPDGWVVTNRETLVSQWLSDYPGAGGLQSYWYALDSPAVVAQKARELAAELEIDCLLSGDAAAQTYAPWRLPVSTHAYAREFIDYTVLGYSPANPEQSNLKVSLPADPTIWITALHEASTHDGLVDPLLAYWDLAHAAGPDAIESANHLLGAIDTGRWLL